MRLFYCGGLALAGEQVPTKAALSLTKVDRDEGRYKRPRDQDKGSYLARTKRAHVPRMHWQQACAYDRWIYGAS